MIIISGTLTECKAVLMGLIGSQTEAKAESNNTSILEISVSQQSNMQPCDDCNGILSEDGRALCERGECLLEA